MDNKALKEIFESQGKAIATLAVRLTTIEEILLEKKIITEAEVAEKALNLSKEFVARTQEALRKVEVEESKKKNK